MVLLSLICHPVSSCTLMLTTQCNPFAPSPLQRLQHYYELLRPNILHQYYQPHCFSNLTFPLASIHWFPQFHRKARNRLTPPTRRTPFMQHQSSLINSSRKYDLAPGFDVNITRYRRVVSGSFTFVFLFHTCQICSDFSSLLMTHALNMRHMKWFQARSWSLASAGLPPSFL